jgi:hypothetical protein
LWIIFPRSPPNFELSFNPIVASTYHPTTNWLTLPDFIIDLYYIQAKRDGIHKNRRIMRGDIMAENKTQDYTYDSSEGHVDTRERNFECENKDEHLGCDMGIDVAG